MKPPSIRYVERARQLLAHEAGTAGETAAVRVFDKLSERLTPLLGAAGVQLLFVRSAKLTQGELSPAVPTTILGDGAKVRELLAARDPALSADTATTLFANFLTLITTFIGERLTLQVLRGAWPNLEEKRSRGEDK